MCRRPGLVKSIPQSVTTSWWELIVYDRRAKRATAPRCVVPYGIGSLAPPTSGDAITIFSRRRLSMGARIKMDDA